MILDMTPEDWNVLVRGGLLGLSSFTLFLLRGVYTRFKKMERETFKIEENHKFVLKQFDNIIYNIDNLQADVNRVLDVLLHSQYVDKRDRVVHNRRSTDK